MALRQEPVEAGPEPSGARVSPGSILELVVGRVLGAVVVTLHGEVTAASCEVLGDVLADLIDGQGNLFVVVELGDVVIAEGERLEVLVAARNSLRQRGGRFVLAAPPGRTRDVLQAAGLAEVIEVHPERRYHPSMTTSPPP